MSKSDYPEFNPTLTARDGLFHYDDGRVSGMVDISTGSVAIYEWNSFFKGQGHTKTALEWFRGSGADSISAINMGMPPSDGEEADTHVLYWLHLRDLGLVDVLIDDESQLFDDSFHVSSKMSDPAHPTLQAKRQSDESLCPFSIEN